MNYCDEKNNLELKQNSIFGVFVGFFVGTIFFFIFFKFIILNIFFNFNYSFNDFKKKELFINDNCTILSNNDDFTSYGNGKIIIQLKKNDNLFNALIREGFTKESINGIMSVLYKNKKIDIKSFKEKQTFVVMYNYEIVFSENISNKNVHYPIMKKKVENRTIMKLLFKTQKGIKYIIEKNAGGYIFQIEKPKLITKTHIINGSIKNNLFEDAIVGGIKISTLYNVLNEYAFLIDFQRDLRSGDKFIFVLETVKDGDGDIIEEKVLYTNLILRKHNYEMFNFDGSFYDRKGKSIQKKLLKTPVDGARITSGFKRRRKHPILGYTRAHKGVDMAVPTGTPIYAAGDGVVLEIRLNHPGYGKYVLIRHNSEYSTKYAHMSRVARLKIGQRVKQRQVIGYVGMTGLATGPHLHYEVIRRGKHINPSSINIVETKKINQSKINEFKKFVNEIDNTLKIG